MHAMVGPTVCTLILACAACSGGAEPDVVPAGVADLFPVDEGTDPEYSVIARRHRAFMGALVDSAADPSGYMSPYFTFRNAADSAGNAVRLPGGGPAFGTDFLSALSIRVAAPYATAATVELVRVRPDHYIVITRPHELQPAITRWERDGDRWIAVSLVINVDEAVIARLAPAAPRVRQSPSDER